MSFRFLALALATVVMSAPAVARDYISIAGSSTVFPFATIIAEKLGQNPAVKTPVVESGGSSVGKKGVCDGIGTQFIDIGDALTAHLGGLLDEAEQLAKKLNYQK